MSFVGMVTRRDPLRDAYAIVAVVWVLAVAAGVVDAAPDALGWYVHRLPDPYVVKEYSVGYGFFFTPPIAFLIYPLTLVPVTVFLAIWTAMMLASVYYLAGRLAIVAVFIPPVFAEVYQGNVNLLLGAAALAMLRWPAVGSFLLLTKLTPGIALLWFAVRREWRRLGVALLATACLTAISIGLAPSLWTEWADLLRGALSSPPNTVDTLPVPLLPRLLAAAIVVILGARANRPWVLPIAVTLSVPTLWFATLAPLVGIVRGRMLELGSRPPVPRPAADQR